MDKSGAGLILLLAVLIAIIPMTAIGEEAGMDTHSNIPKAYSLGSGDVIRVAVWKNEDISGEYLIRPDGKFSLPLVGDVIAAGKTTDSINLQIEQKLKFFIEKPYVSVILTEPHSNRVYVLGEVVNPGDYEIRSTLTVLQALALAGGFTEYAKRNEIAVIRRESGVQVKKVVSFKEILNSPNSGQNLSLERGDTLVVP